MALVLLPARPTGASEDSAEVGAPASPAMVAVTN